MQLTETQQKKVKWLQRHCKFIKSVQQFIETTNKEVANNEEARIEMIEWAWALKMQ